MRHGCFKLLEQGWCRIFMRHQDPRSNFNRFFRLNFFEKSAAKGVSIFETRFLPLHSIFMQKSEIFAIFYCAGGANLLNLRDSCEVRGSSLKNFSRTLFSKKSGAAYRWARNLLAPSVRKGCPQWENHTSFWRAEFPDRHN